MKKQFIIFLGLSLIIGKVSAQLTLDHTFSGYLLGSYPYVEEPIGLYYNAAFVNSNSFYLYNSNYSLYKTVILNLPSGYSLFQVSSLGKHIINTDEKAEFFIAAHNSNNVQWAKIVNEDGVIIQDFGNGNSISCSTHKVGNQLRLIVRKVSYNNSITSYQTDVYICQGNYSAVASFENENTTMQPYPNPTTTLINLPYRIEKGTVSTINIYNINGQLVDSYNIGGDFEMITIDVNNYSKGIYVYEYNGISNRFVVQ